MIVKIQYKKPVYVPVITILLTDVGVSRREKMSIRGQLIAAQQQHQHQQQQHQQQHSPSPAVAPQSPMSEHMQHQQQLVNNQLNNSFKLQSNGSGNGMVMMQKSVAIVTPQRSNSMDYLNFEERRQLIASSLSLSEILSGQGGAPAKESATVNDTGLGKSRCGCGHSQSQTGNVHGRGRDRVCLGIQVHVQLVVIGHEFVMYSVQLVAIGLPKVKVKYTASDGHLF